jgi:hypothetical protein
MHAGERHLAIHANCGTNVVASGFIAGLLAWLGMAGARSRREKVDRLPLAIALATLGLILSQPLGPAIQARVTTSGDPEGMSIVDIFPVRFGMFTPAVRGFTIHRVITQG